MFQLYDMVKLKNGDATVSVSPNDIAVIVDIAKSKNGEVVYTLEFIDENGNTNEDALYKYYTSREMVKI